MGEQASQKSHTFRQKNRVAQLLVDVRLGIAFSMNLFVLMNVFFFFLAALAAIVTV